jgi:hypothetical protein
MSNGIAGITLNGAATRNVIGSSLTEVHPPNIIFNNGQAGLIMTAASGTPQQNTVRDNIFHDNTGFGIRILSGQGGIQPPELESYVDDGQGTSTIVGRHVLAGATIDLYAGDTNQSNRQEGVEWLGSGPVDASGYFAITISSCSCDSLVATATDVLGNTSEFSNGWAPTTSITSLDDAPRRHLAFPNPFRTSLTIEFQADDRDEISFEIMDLWGRDVLSGRHAVQTGVQQIVWCPDKSITPGYYMYRLTDGQGGAVHGKVAYLGGN